MIRTEVSRDGVLIRLTDERWAHIIEEHCELAGLREEVMQTVAEAERVFAGKEGELLAVRRTPEGRALVVVYKEVDATDGFVITAFLTSRPDRLERRDQRWPPKK